MSVDQSFLTGNYQGVKFLFVNNSQSGGRKIAVHEYPQSDNRTIQDLGQYLPVYDITIWITGNAQTYRQNKEDILKALDTDPNEYLTLTGRDTNFIHPIDGSLAVYAEKYSVSENSDSFGKCEIKVKLYSISKITYPVADLGDGSVEVKNIFDQVLDAINEAFEDIFDLIIDLQNLLSKILDYINNLISILQNALTIVEVASGALSEFVNNLNNLADSIVSVVQSPSDLANNISNIYQNMTNLGKTTADKSILNQNIFGFNSGTQQDITTLAIQKSEQNRKAINTYINSISLIYELLNTVNSDYATNDDIVTQSDILTDQLKNVIDNNFYIDENGATQNLFNQDVIDNITDMYNKTVTYLTSQATNNKNIITQNISNDSLLSLVYRYYGDIDLYDQINNLNALGNPFEIKKDIKFLG